MVLVTSSRFTEVDFQIAQEVQSMNIPISFVRTKLDLDVTNSKNKPPYKGRTVESVTEELVHKIRANTMDNLKLAGFEISPVYIISAPAYLGNTEIKCDENLLYKQILDAAIRQRCMYCGVELLLLTKE